MLRHCDDTKEWSPHVTELTRCWARQRSRRDVRQTAPIGGRAGGGFNFQPDGSGQVAFVTGGEGRRLWGIEKVPH